VKLRKYADAGIPHYWRVEEEPTGLAVHVYELDVPTRTPIPVDVSRDVLSRPVPFPITIDLGSLTPRR
jgi:hypothetical protein